MARREAWRRSGTRGDTLGDRMGNEYPCLCGAAACQDKRPKGIAYSVTSLPNSASYDHAKAGRHVQALSRRLLLASAFAVALALLMYASPSSAVTTTTLF